MKAIGITKFLDKKFIALPFTDDWLAFVGEPEKNFKMIIFGHPGKGKTELCVRLAKYLTQFTKVYYNSYEQGISKSLQDSFRRNNMEEVAGRLMLGHREGFDDMMKRLGSHGSPGCVVIDSRDYLNLTSEQYKEMITRFPRKSFIIVCWEQSGKPRSKYGQAIEYMCDIKVHVADFRAYPRSRFGGNKPYVIWDKTASPGEQVELILQEAIKP